MDAESRTTVDDTCWQQLERELGAAFLGYMLNSSEPQLSAISRESLNAQQQDVLGRLCKDVTQLYDLGLIRGDAAHGPSPLGTLLMNFDDKDGTTSVNLYRQYCGGVLAPVSGDDGSPERYLSILARDCYAANLLPPPFPEMPWMGSMGRMTSSMWRHPVRQKFEDGVRADAVLAALFADYDKSTGFGGQYYTNLGFGGSIQLWSLAEGLVSSAYDRMALDGLLSPSKVAEASIENLTLLRKLVAGKKVQIRARIGIAGISLEQQAISTPWGVLRPATSEESARVDKLDGTRTDAVFEVPVDMRLYIGSGSPEDGDSGPGAMGKVSQKLHNDVNDRFLRLALSLFLSLERSRPVTAVRSWTAFDRIFSPMGTSWSQVAPLVSSARLEEGEADTVTEWIDRVQKHYHRSITIAVQRVLHALAERYDPADGLVDAVIALENLFGTSSETQGEVTFRVSTACAYLLSPEDAKERRAARKDVVGIYRERSKIVHGQQPGEDVGQLRDRAVEIIREALQLLFRDRPELLPVRDRALALILG
jgi:Apea-like HEPN